MDIPKIIQQLRNTDLCPYLAGNVEGVAEFERARLQAANQVQGTGGVTITTTSTQVSLVPAAYVMFVSGEPGENTTRTGLRQIVTETFEVVVMIPMADLLGTAATIQVHDVLVQLRSALLNWTIEPTRALRGCYEGTNSREASDNARYWHRFTFKQDILITDADGYQKPTASLSTVVTTIANPEITVSTTIAPSN